jgi:3-isopropylmalate dehydrogenase
MLLRYSLSLPKEADAVERAVEAVLDAGWRTGDISGTDADVSRLVGTRMMGDLVIEEIR